MPRRDAVSRSIVERHLEARALLVAGHVAELGQRLQLASSIFGRPLRELVGVGVLEGVLVLRAAGAAVDLEVLHGLQVERRSRRPWRAWAGGASMISLRVGLALARAA